jgi:SPP1 family phage portal protein
MYTIDKETTIDATLLKEVIEFNESRRSRFDKLANYYIGQHDILDRTKSDTLANNKVMVNHARYIVDTSVGYLLGNPVGYQVPKELDIQPVLDAYKKQTISNLDSEIAKDLGIFGIQYEYVYVDEDSQPISVELDNRNTIIVYDTTIQHNKLFAITYRPIKLKGKKDPDYYDVMLIDAEKIQRYKLKGNDLTEVDKAQVHAFGAVPVIEYRNNADYLGDFEPVISLIDAYNVLQSDRVNDREQLVDAILVAINFKFGKEQLADLKDNRLVSGIPENGKLEYLVKQLNEGDTDVLRQTLEADIHKISMVPNMSDKEFVGNASGVAIRYKLLNFEQATQNKERYFESGLMERFKLYMNYLSTASKMSKPVPLEDVDAKFSRNLPGNDYEISQMIVNLDGIVDRQQLVSQLSFVDDAKETVELAAAEAKKRLEDAQGQFGTDNATGDDEDEVES